MSTEPVFAFLPQGAIIQEFNIGGLNIVQGFPEAKYYKTHNGPFFGETIGRTTNRLRDAKINDLNGKVYELAANNGPNSLHGGSVGWGKQDFEGPTAVNRNGKEGVLFKYLSKDGEAGYPGTVELRVWYTSSLEDGVAVLETEYEVEFIGDEAEETAVGITNHSYFNLSGESTIAGTEAILATDQYLPIDEGGIPTGTIEKFPGTDTAKSFILTETAPDIDDCFIVNTDSSSIPLDTRSGRLTRLGAFHHSGSGVHLEVYSTEPAFQFYTGKYINVPAVEGAPARGARSGFCVEPSRYVNAINVPEWKSQMLLKKGQIWGSKTVYKGWKA